MRELEHLGFCIWFVLLFLEAAAKGSGGSFVSGHASGAGATILLCALPSLHATASSQS